jgi:cytochrome c-type biogenesis protein CcmH
MESGEQQRPRLGTIGLRLVMAAAVVAIGVAVWRGSDPGRQEPAATAALADPLTALEARTRENPKDGAAWSELAARYFDAGRFDDAVAAYGAAIGQNPREAALWSARGEARVMASKSDPMPAAAVADFKTAFGLDPKDPRARYFLAVAQDLAGDHQGAIDAWLALLADTPPGAVWEADLRRTIEQVGEINKIDVAQRLGAVKQPPPASPVLAAIPGPSAEDLSRASAMPPSEQRAMAEGMVARLEGRLRGDPGNVDGWLMLIRSRMTLDEPDKASAALEAAVKANPGAADQLREQAAMLGVR